VFETLRIYGGTPFAVRRHLERLAASATGMGLAVPDAEVLRRAMAQVIEANALSEGRMRITLTAGPGPMASDRADLKPTLMVACGPASGGLPAKSGPASVDVVMAPWPRHERGALAGIKSISYGENVLALAYAQARNAGEAILANTVGNLCEGTGSNLFVAIGGRLYTPPLSAGCLAGVTRALVCEAVNVAQEDVPADALAGVEEAFLTSSTREIQPIRAVDGTAFPLVAGPLTTAAALAFADVMAADVDP